mmetsp:Transcript_80112/g.126365  ORF Transcript_80112/g.126365 Transcript_80112/m.126365 type:complete len:218 (-) Transcript_80112:1370-2023(-)
MDIAPGMEVKSPPGSPAGTKTMLGGASPSGQICCMCKPFSKSSEGFKGGCSQRHVSPRGHQPLRTHSQQHSHLSSLSVETSNDGMHKTGSPFKPIGALPNIGINCGGFPSFPGSPNGVLISPPFPGMQGPQKGAVIPACIISPGWGIPLLPSILPCGAKPTIPTCGIPFPSIPGPNPGVPTNGVAPRASRAHWRRGVRVGGGIGIGGRSPGSGVPGE